METAIRHTHLLSVILFLLVYLIKTFLLVTNKNEGLAKFTKIVKVPEMIISAAFLLTGVYMLIQLPEIKSLLIIKIIAVLISIPLAIVGFKKGNKALAVTSLLLIILAYGLAEMSKKQKSKSMETINETVINGKEIYNASCTSCHGQDGKLGLMGAKDLTQSEMDVSAKIEIIKNGKNAMTPFAGMLNDEQIKAVAAYTDSLKN
jgi:mono/diheme cytochrome c family protein